MYDNGVYIHIQKNVEASYHFQIKSCFDHPGVREDVHVLVYLVGIYYLFLYFKLNTVKNNIGK